MGYLLIIRPLNCLITAFSVLVGAWIGLPKTFNASIFIAMIIGFFACGYGNIINDIYDIKIDAVNAPHRPLVKGTVKKKYAVLESIILAAACLVLALMLDLKAFLLVSAALSLLFLYACIIKKYWMANITIALLTGFSFLLGGLANNNIVVLFPFAFSILIHMPREIIKDIIDEIGDRQREIITCAARLGSQKARNTAAVYLGMLCLMLPLPFIVRILNWHYMILILFAAIPLILYMIIRTVLRPEINDLKKLSRLFKLVMGIGLIAMLI